MHFTSMNNHYDILGIPESADSNTIKNAYRKQVLIWHPDRNRNKTDEAKLRFQVILQSYYILSDRHLRAEYEIYFFY